MMEYGEHGVKEDNFGAIYPALSKEHRETEPEGEMLKLEKHQSWLLLLSPLWDREFFN